MLAVVHGGRARLGAPDEGRPVARSRRATASRGCASRSATGTRSRCSRTSRSCSGCGSAPRAGIGWPCAWPARCSCTSRRSSLLLTLSRGGVAAACGGRPALARALARSGSRAALVLAAAAVPAALVGGWAFTRPALVEDVALRSDRVDDGALFGVLTVAGALAVGGLVVWGARRRSARARGRGSGAALVVRRRADGRRCGVVGFAFAVEQTRSRPTPRARRSPTTRAGCARSTSATAGAGGATRGTSIARNAPGGAGAGTFEIARKRFREDARNVFQPHSVPLQHLADGGVAGLGLFLALRPRGVRRRASARCGGSAGRSGRQRSRSSRRRPRTACTLSSTTTGTSSPSPRR